MSISNEQTAPRPAPKPRRTVLRWLEDSPTPFGDCKSQAGNLKLGRLAMLKGANDAEVKLRVVGVAQQWAAASDTEVELYLCGDGSVGAQPVMVRDASVDAAALGL